MSNQETLQIIKNFINEHFEIVSTFNQLEVHQGIISIGGSEYNVVGVVAASNFNAIATKLLNDYSADIILIIDIKRNIALMRKSSTCLVNLSKLAKQLSIGGGTADAAGCILNDKIINITKLLRIC
jgi:nanoRNase/pAp phosphatase (c-di-AMP/oligoRNAs hydrolase)